MKEINKFIQQCHQNDNICIKDFIINNISGQIIYFIDMVNIVKFNEDYLRVINHHNYQSLDYLIPGICHKLSDLTTSNLFYLLSSGKILLLFDNNYYYFELDKKYQRSLSASKIDACDTTSSFDGLIEDLNANLTLIKHRIKTDKLLIKKYVLGTFTKTDCAVLYINKQNNPDLIKINKILNNLDTSNILSINDIAVLYQRNQLVPSVFFSSSPEIISDAILKGKIVILLDNTSIGCIINADLLSLVVNKSYANTPLYYSIFNYSFIAFFLFLALFMMGLFIAIINFHTNILPSFLLANIKITERGTSWSMFIEVLIVYFLFEFYRFATSRSPSNYIQNIIIILGGLFIGQNAIESGTIGGTILFLTSISYIATFAVTNNIYLITSFNIFRLFILIMSYLMGIIGFLLSSIIVIFYLFKPGKENNYYLYPLIPFNKKKFLQLFKNR